jgi:hypothetical protein
LVSSGVVTRGAARASRGRNTNETRRIEPV